MTVGETQLYNLQPVSALAQALSDWLWGPLMLILPGRGGYLLARLRAIAAGLALLGLGMLPLGCSEPPGAGLGPDPASPHRDYLGRYRLSDDLVLVMRDRDGLLTLRPSFWGAALILEPVAEDRWRSRRHPEIELAFQRDTAGVVGELELTGNEEIAGRAARMAPGERLPVEALLEGDAGEALRLLDTAGEESPERALGLAVRLLRNRPSRAATAAVFLDGVAERFRDSSVVHEARGVAWVSAGERDRALPAFRRAIELDAESSWSRVALAHLDPELAPAEPAGWRVPFALADLFRPATEEEIRQVRQRWRERDLSPGRVRVEEKSTLRTEHGAFRQRLVSHLVHGEIHHAAVLVPAEATPGCCPVILDVKGISWDYESRRVTAGLRTLQLMGEEASRFVFAVPGLRGETLEVDGEAYLSEGDRTDGWDGAADDTLALLSAVLEAVPEAHPERACVYGKSRGASVALLAAARDPRLDCAVAWAGPADWLRLMGTWGWTIEEQVGDGLRYEWQPGRGSGSAAQFIEWFLRGPIDTGRPALAEVRARVAASSPIHFVDTLPPSDLHYGVEDRAVPVANGLALRDRLGELGRSEPHYPVTLHRGAGHDMPYPWAWEQSREFLLRHLLEAPSE